MVRDAEMLVPGLSAFGPAMRCPPSQGQDFIYVTRRLSPADYPVLRRCRAVVCEEGGASDHLAVICRILGCPVVRVPDAMAWLGEGTTVGIDGAKGTVRMGWRPPAAPMPTEAAQIVHDHRLRLQVSVVRASDIEATHDLDPSAAVGEVTHFFVREELLWVARELDPFEFLAGNGIDATAAFLAEEMQACVERLRPGQRLNYRSLDWRGEWSGGCVGTVREANPELGLHGIRQLLVRRDMLAAELRALEMLQQGSYAKVTFCLPFVTDPSEVDAVRALATRYLERPLSLGLFIETPAAVSEIDKMLAPDVQCLCVGTKDLTQLILACDRGNTDVQHLYDCTKPPVTSAINTVLEAGFRNDVPVMVFSLLADLPRLIERCVGLGGVSICWGEYRQLAACCQAPR